MNLWAITKESSTLPDGTIVEVDLKQEKGQARWGLDQFIQAPSSMPVWVKGEKQCYVVLKQHLVDFWIS